MRYLYCIFCVTNLRLLGRFKIGITSDMSARRAQISGELGGARLLHFSFWVLFPLKMEKRLHGLFARLRAKVPYHRGYTEWFTIRNYATAALFLSYTDLTGQALAASVLAIIFVPIPWDGVLAVLAVVAVQVVAVLSFVYLIFWLCS